MPRLTETVKHIIIINVLMFFGTQMLMGDGQGMISSDMQLSDLGRLSLAMFFPTSDFFRPYQIVTHMFMHANIGHLFFNMFAVAMFGSALESYWGSKKFLLYYFVTGIGALLLYIAFQYFEYQFFTGKTAQDLFNLQGTPMLGASGAVFGLLAAFGMIFPNTVLQLIFPPIPLKAKYFVLIYAGIELFLGLGRFNTGIAHFAHLGGALFGVIMVLYWRKVENRW